MTWPRARLSGCAIACSALAVLVAGTACDDASCLINACACTFDSDCPAGAVCIGEVCAEGAGRRCPSDPQAGVVVTVTDLETELQVCDATVTVTDAADPADVEPFAPRFDADGCSYVGEPDRIGTFDVAVSHPTYVDSGIVTIEVFADECGHAVLRNVPVRLAAIAQYEGDVELGVVCGQGVCRGDDVCCVTLDPNDGELIEACEVSQCSALSAASLACDGPEDCLTDGDVCCLSRDASAGAGAEISGASQCVAPAECPTTDVTSAACTGEGQCGAREVCCAVETLGAEIDVGACLALVDDACPATSQAP